MKFSDKASRGRKLCPGCDKYVGARSFQCKNCRHIFSKVTKKAPAQPKISKTPGRGKRQCPGCKNFMGVRNKVCPVCGHDFNKGKVSSSYIPPEDRHVPLPYDLIAIPSGRPPIILRRWNDESYIRNWIVRTREWGKENRNEYYKTSALIYWLRFFWDVHSDKEKHNTARALVEKIASEPGMGISSIHRVVA